MQSIRSGISLFKAYLDINDSERKYRQLHGELQFSGVSMIHCPHNGRIDVVDKVMLVDMLAFAIDRPPPATFVIISAASDFSYFASTLKGRGYSVVMMSTEKNAMPRSPTYVMLDFHATLTSNVDECNQTSKKRAGFVIRDNLLGFLAPAFLNQLSKRYALSETDDPEARPTKIPWLEEGVENYAQQMSSEEPMMLTSQKVSSKTFKRPKAQYSLTERMCTFGPLVKIIEGFRNRRIRSGRLRQMLNKHPTAYRLAKVDRFGRYIKKAESADIVTVENKAKRSQSWITLRDYVYMKELDN